MVDYNGLENRRTERYRGFESLSLRNKAMQQVEISELHRFLILYEQMERHFFLK